MRKLYTIVSIFMLILLFAANFSFAQTVRLEQGYNGGIDQTPVSPVTWSTGNSNNSNSHFFEGQSIPYRVTISKLRPNFNGVIEIEWDTRTNGKSAIDYITGFDRICEVVEPVPGLSYGSNAYQYALIPVPGSGSGNALPAESFNRIPESDRMLAIHGGRFGEISYVVEQSPTSTTAITRIRINFSSTGTLSGTNNTVVIAWGGHIADAKDWGEGNSASSITGSPYRTSLVSLNGKSVGTQDRSVQAASTSIDLDPACNIIGVKEICAGSSSTYSVPAGALSYNWSVTGGTISAGEGTNSITVNWTESGSVSVIVTNPESCAPTSCSLNVVLKTPPTLTVEDAVLCSTDNGGNTAEANLLEFVDVSFGGLIFKRNGSIIQTPEAITVTDGDLIEVTAVGGCGSTETFKVTVNDRQIFGICSQGKVYEPIGSELKALFEVFKKGQTVESNEIFYIDKNEVLVEVIYVKDKFARAKTILDSLGFLTPTEEELKQDPNSVILAGFIPIGKLLDLNLFPLAINSVRPAIPGVPNKGATTTQGDRVMRSNLVRAGYVHRVGDQAIDGTGIKIGVLSDSYATRNDPGVNTLANDISNGDLPGSLYFLRDMPSRFGIGTDEGRAMIQIIHDVAPGAQLGFRTGVITAGDFAQGIRDLAAAGSDIIVDDITYVTEPFFSDGKVAKAVNEVTANGVSYFTSAGNFGTKSFEGVFNPVTTTSVSLPLKEGEWTNGGRIHQFGNGNTTQSIQVYPGQNGPAVYMIALQWDDPLYSVDQTGSLYDLDIYLKDFGAPLFGFNRNNANGDPIEILSFTISAPTTVELLIARECSSCLDLDSNKGIKFKYVVFRGELDPEDPNNIKASTIVGHANAEGAMSVGAVLYANTSVFGFNPALVPSGTLPFTVANFSSRGGTITNGELRNKPDFTGPNGVNTTVDFGAPNIERDLIPGDQFPNFFGTSAAAPHVAAVAALIKQARLKYYPGTNPTGWVGGVGVSLPADIRRVLKTTAQDMHEAGEDIKSGSGLVRADRALLTLAAPNPSIIRLDTTNAAVQGGFVGDVSFTLIIRGSGFYEDSEVLFRDKVIPSVFNPDSSYLEVTIPDFQGNPSITVVNNAISDLGLDGGTAGPVNFFDVVKKTIAIRAENQTKKYAQELEPLTARVYERVGSDWALSTLTLEDVGVTLNAANVGTSLKPLSLSSPISISGDLAEVGTYIITALHPQTGFAFSDFFNYVGVVQQDGNLFYDGTSNAFGNYGPGIITVEPLPITIKPIDLTGSSALQYGESISEALKFDVIIPEELIEFEGKVKIADVQSLKDAILSQYFQDLALAKQLGDNSLPLGIFNGRTMLDKAIFTNKSFMVSAQTMLNGRTLFTNGRTIFTNARTLITNSAFDVPAESFVDYFENDQEDQALIPVTIDGRVMINSRTIFNSQTIINGQTIINSQSIINGQTIINSKTIVNARTIFNGKSIINSQTIINTTGGTEDGDNNTLVIFGEKDLEGAEIVGDTYDFGEDDPNTDSDDFNIQFFSVSMVSGIDVGEQFIIPGTFESRNYLPSYQTADLTITSATLTATTSANPDLIEFGDTAPEYSTEFEGFEVKSSFLDPAGVPLTVEDNVESVIDEPVGYSLLKDNATFPSSGLIGAGIYEIDPIISLIQPSNYVLGTITRGGLTVDKATPTVSVTGGLFEFDGEPIEATAFAYGIGGMQDFLDLTLITILYEGTGSTNYGPIASAPVLPGTYRVIANFAGNANYNTASSAYASLIIVGCIKDAPVMGEFSIAKGSGSTSNSATISRPANTKTGDLLIVGLMIEKGQAPNVTPPDNTWILIRRVNQLNQVAMVTYYKVITSNNEPLTYRFRISQSPKWSIGISRVSGADINHPKGPIVADSGLSGAQSLIATAPSLTTVDCNTMIMVFFTNKKDATWTPPAGTIEVYDDPNNQQGLTSNMMAYYIQSEPGRTGDLSATASLSEHWVAQAIAIRPLPLVTNLQSARTQPLSSETISELSIAEGISTLQQDGPSGELIAYPNPVKDRMSLSLRGLVEEEPTSSSLVILDAMGRTHQLPQVWYENESRLELDFSQMHVGFYIININTVEGVKSIRVIKHNQ